MSFFSKVADFVQHPIDTVMGTDSSDSSQESSSQETTSVSVFNDSQSEQSAGSQDGLQIERTSDSSSEEADASSDETSNDAPAPEEKSWWQSAKDAASSVVNAAESAAGGALGEVEDVASSALNSVDNLLMSRGETAVKIEGTSSSAGVEKPLTSSDLENEYNTYRNGSDESKKALYSDLAKKGIETGYWSHRELAMRTGELEDNPQDLDRSLDELYKQVQDRQKDIENGSADGASQGAKDLKDYQLYRKTLLGNIEDDAQLAIQNGRMSTDYYDNELLKLHNSQKYEEGAEEVGDKVKDIRETQSEIEQTTKDFNDAKTHRGWIGGIWDSGKNILNSMGIKSIDSGSVAVGKDLDAKKAELTELMQNYDANKDEIEKLKGEMKQRGTEYKSSLDSEVDMTADIAACAAGKVVEVAGGIFSAATLGAGAPIALAATAATGSAIKMGLKSTNAWSAGKTYDTAGYDAITGAASGVLLPGVGKGASMLLGKVGLSAAEKVVGEGAIKTFAKGATDFVAQNEAISFADAESKQVAANLTGTHTDAQYHFGEGSVAGAGLGIAGKVIGKTVGKVFGAFGKDGVNKSWKGKDDVTGAISINPNETLTNIVTKLENIKSGAISASESEIAELEKLVQAKADIPHADTFNKPIAKKYDQAKALLADIKGESVGNSEPNILHALDATSAEDLEMIAKTTNLQDAVTNYKQVVEKYGESSPITKAANNKVNELHKLNQQAQNDSAKIAQEYAGDPDYESWNNNRNDNVLAERNAAAETAVANKKANELDKLN